MNTVVVEHGSDSALALEASPPGAQLVPPVTAGVCGPVWVGAGSLGRARPRPGMRAGPVTVDDGAVTGTQRNAIPDLAGNVAGLLRQAARRDPGHPAVISAGRALTWGELDAAVDAGVSAIGTLGLGQGARIAVALPSTELLVVVLFAAARAGLVAACCEPAQAELARTAARVEAQATVAAGGTITDADVADWLGVRDSGGRVPAQAAGRADTANGASAAGGEDLALLARAPRAERPVMLSHRAVLGAVAAMTSAPGYRLAPSDRVLMAVPLYHVSGWARSFLPVVACGATAVFADPASLAALASPDAAVVLEEIRAYRVTVLSGTPGLYEQIAGQRQAERALATVRLMTSGATSLDPEVFAAIKAVTGQGVWEGYGLSEAAGVVTSALMCDRPRPGAVGTALPGVELRILGPDGQDLYAVAGESESAPDDMVADLPESGEVGRIAIRGTPLFSGYWPDGAGGPDADGWFTTDDVGYLDAAGELRLVDRAGEALIIAGFTVYPREVEDALRAHPHIADAVVLGVPGRAGEQVAALLVATPGANPTQEDLSEFLSATLPDYKHPVRYQIVAELPRTEVGRLDRVAARTLVRPEEPQGEPGAAAEGGPGGGVAPEEAAGLGSLGSRLPAVGDRNRRSAKDTEDDLF